MNNNILIIAIILAFITVSPVIGYACETRICTQIECSLGEDCYDRCGGSYFYYGESQCNSRCPFSDPKVCKFQYSTCADANTTDGYPLINDEVRACGAACDQDSDYNQIENTCYYNCDTGACDYVDSCSVEAYCDASVAYYDGSCAGDGCAFESQDCSEIPDEIACSGVGTDTLIESTTIYGCQFGECKTSAVGIIPMPCDADKEFQTVECGGTDYYCYYDDGYRWGETYPETETDCSDGHDNDNDTLIDGEDTDCFECTPEEERACDLQSGVCVGSMETCTELGQWLGCDYGCITDYEAEEVSCDGIDNDCDGEIDENCECSVSEDCNDGNTCTIGECTDGDCIYTNLEDGTVCDDSDSNTINDVCSIGVCTGETDSDGDGYGDDDCNDSDPDVNPGTEEVCGDEIDNNCDGNVDEGCAECEVNDDCFSSNTCMVAACVDGTCIFDNAEDGTTCDDENPDTINDACTSGVCGGYADEDDDGYDENEDCDDTNPEVYPGAPEVCEDGIDNDCDGNADCSDDNCNESPSCGTPYTPSGGGFFNPTGGAIINEVICGDGTCEYGETCSNCPEDCFEEGEVCCDEITYSGSCCVDADCGEGFECTLAKTCNALQIIGGDIDNGPSYCEQEWICTDWTSCDEGVQSRTCVEADGCDTVAGKPVEIEECTAEEISPLTGLFLLATSPYGIVFIAGMLILLIMFLLRRKKK